jgi:hypothetical protein
MPVRGSHGLAFGRDPFGEKPTRLTTRATPVKGVARPHQICETGDAYVALITLHARVARKTNEPSDLLHI